MLSCAQLRRNYPVSQSASPSSETTQYFCLESLEIATSLLVLCIFNKEHKFSPNDWAENRWPIIISVYFPLVLALGPYKNLMLKALSQPSAKFLPLAKECLGLDRAVT